MNKFKILFIGGSLVLSFSAFAGSTDEVEDNNTRAQAQKIERNMHYVYDYIEGTNLRQNIVKGEISQEGDVDWYKVFLPEGEATLHITKGNATFEIFDKDGNSFLRRPYIDNRLTGMCVPKENHYRPVYVKVSGNVGEYAFSIGQANLDMREGYQQEVLTYTKYFGYGYSYTYTMHRERADLSDYIKGTYGYVNGTFYEGFNRSQVGGTHYYDFNLKVKDTFEKDIKDCIGWKIRDSEYSEFLN